VEQDNNMSFARILLREKELGHKGST